MTFSTARKSGALTDPKTKANLLDRMNSRDFSGDLADLAVNRDLRYERTRPNAMLLKFGHSGKVFEIVVRKPRSEEQLAAMRAKAEGKAIRVKAPKRQSATAAAEGTEVGGAPAKRASSAPRRAPKVTNGELADA